MKPPHRAQRDPGAIVPVLASDERLLPAARQISVQFGLPLTQEPAGHRLLLRLRPESGATDYRLELVAAGPGSPGPVTVDFAGGAPAHRRRFGGGRGQPLARAVGLKGGASLTVADLTAGLGRDAFVLASLGAEVWLVERCGAVAALLADGLRRAAADAETESIAARMHLVHADGAAWLAQRPAGELPDVVYLDPMYPERRKSALVKKEMRLVRMAAGDDPDAAEVLAAALARSCKRVVVKRPRTAPPLPGPPPSAAIASPNTRFDLYLQPG